MAKKGLDEEEDFFSTFVINIIVRAEEGEGRLMVREEQITLVLVQQ